MKQKISEIRPDSILFQIDSNFLQIKRIKKAFPNLVVCTQINGSPFDEPFKNIAFKEYFIKKQKEAYEKSDLNFFVSEISRNNIMQSSFEISRDIVIPNGANLDKFFPIKGKEQLKQKLGYDVNKFILGYVGTLDFHKKIVDLVEVFHELTEIYKDLQLVIIGDGPALDQIINRIEDLELTDNVILKGWVNHNDINEHLNCFNLAIHHSAQTYMNPLKIFEYLAAGLPVLAPDIPSVRRIFQNEIDLLITGDKKKDIKDNLEMLIQNPQMRERFSRNKNLKRSLEKNYTWKRYAENIIIKIQQKLNQ
ncbi:glycosyltransferase family 4 protein [Salegentibacter sp. F188]|uniref:Glycosyltransferase family 4 protein n=1 Tax=Autumnicola patrickiae TaxID=3075591 RepID=A0ABU3E1K3_9FLAO|nr:glycosyltransferase family 4 protein [Salegentibacter sp. F188]MDT0689836.1 glycosyltransferase family 4 protein [Salegentibacter sp. F188]